MKLIYDTAVDNVITENEINESTGSKKYVIKGIFSSPGVRNKNGRVYPSAVWEREVEKYQDVLKSGSSNSLLELNHPPRQDVDMMEAVAKMTKLYIDGNYVMGEAVLLDNPKANQLKTLIDNGIRMSVSSRGVGTVKNGLVEDFRLITFDVIPNQQQSDINASMMGIVEGILENKEYEVTESGSIKEIQMCSKSACSMYKPEDIKEAIKQKFSSVLDSLTPVEQSSDYMTEGFFGTIMGTMKLSAKIAEIVKSAGKPGQFDVKSKEDAQKWVSTMNGIIQDSIKAIESSDLDNDAKKNFRSSFLSGFYGELYKQAGTSGSEMKELFGWDDSLYNEMVKAYTKNKL